MSTTFSRRIQPAYDRNRTLADRMDPYTAATNFFRTLARLPGWKSMTPTEAAHAVQVNADPGYYAQYWGDAQTVVAALGG